MEERKKTLNLSDDEYNATLTDAKVTSAMSVTKQEADTARLWVLECSDPSETTPNSPQP